MATVAAHAIRANLVNYNTRRIQENAQLYNLCESAFHAEHNRQFDRAHQLHSQAIEALKNLNNPGSFGNDEKRAAKKLIKFHTARRQLIKPLKDGEQTELPLILPTSVSAQEELVAVKSGSLPISMEERWLAKYLKDKESDHSLVLGPQMQHLLQNPVALYTPTLDPTLPDVTYNISMKADVQQQQNLYYYKVKLATDDRQTLYVLKVTKRRGYQIPIAMFHRSSEFMNSCIQITITPVAPQVYEFPLRSKGRPMELSTSSRVIKEQPDQLEHDSWGLRRFTYGGRQFVWISEKNESHPQMLYEVEKTWPNPDSSSKTGEKEHKLVGRKLAWGKNKPMSWNKHHVLHMVGGMDQLFREYILASQLTRLAVMEYGHIH